MFQFPNTNNFITKEYLLERNSQETYMETYLGIPVRKGLFKSPLRADSKPTASFYKTNTGKLIFHDFSGSFSGDFIAVVMFKFNCSYTYALKIIANDFGYLNENITRNKIRIASETYKTNNKSIIQITKQDFTIQELNWWNKFGITLNTLKKYNVYSCKHIFLNGSYLTSSSPKKYIFGYFGGIKDGVELWRIYFPLQRTFRFISNWDSIMIQGINNLQFKNHCIITKSLKDVMTLYENNINSIAPNCETILINKERISYLKNKIENIIIFFDNDLAGVKGANKYKKENNIKCLFIRRKYGKDISDLKKIYSKDKFNDIINDLYKIISNPIKQKTKYFYLF